MERDVHGVDDDVRELVPGLWRVRTPLPGHSVGTLNSYLIASAGQAAVVDTPWGTPEAIAAFAARLDATGVDPATVGQVLVTHYHEDHSGAAGWLHQKYGAQVLMGAREHIALRYRFGPGEPLFAVRLAGWLEEIGADPEAFAFAFAQQQDLRSRLHSIPPVRALADGDTVQVGEWLLEAVETPGHTPGHLCFVERRRGLLFAGDHVFRRRRGNAVARPLAPRRPIAAYWRAMDRLRDTGADTVLPGHGASFTGLGPRAEELWRIGERKRAEVHRLTTEPATAWTVAQRMRRRTGWEELDANARLAAAGEAMAYLLDAQDAGTIIRVQESPRLWKCPRTPASVFGERKEDEA